jgi:hypothetical protein
MPPRTRTRCTAAGVRPPRVPARRAACRSVAPGALDALLGAAERLYIAALEPDGQTTIDVLDRDGTFVARFVVGGRDALAEALLRDATGHPPRPATVDAFTHEILDHLPRDGFAVSSSDVCAWLLLRAIERTHNT